ncbi:hypothetical protein [Candidatus Liberibacter solanacearum]|uniref:Uncharacterized protein n=1 Tax=Candidatus Liberibacter solanacearum TaxID=556287 RepID=A0A1V2N918_9HYPH|nr:hypothetical protein [Candidatus Liberibacter solanacearum]ONI58585.1 hypothetical protein AYJ09_05415 [Candidatus Liberibacter solanacearum]ONI60198.1 hypothetical protein AYO25_01275 [Candidatus Liberibacter solanacearum]
MVELNFKKPYVEPIAPNQDAVRDAVNPLGGLQDISVAIRQSTEMLDKLRQANVYGDANTQFTSLSAETNTDFMNYTNSLDMRHTREAGEKINTYINNTLRKKYDNFISTIPNREVRQKFAMQKEHDLRSYQKQGLDIQIGAVTLAQVENANISTNFSADIVRNDPSNETHSRQIQSIENHINSLPLDPIKKQDFLNKAKENLHTNQIMGAYQKDPKIFDGFLTASYKNVSAPKDPTSISDVIDASGERELEVNLDVSKKIGLAGWDRLDDSKRRHLLEHLTNRDNAVNNKRKREFIGEAKALESLLDKGEIHPNAHKLTLERAMDVLGGEAGMELYDLIDFKLKSAPKVKEIKTMTTPEVETFLKEAGSKITELGVSPAYMVRYKNYHDHLAKVHKESMDLLRKDPVEWAVANAGMKPLRFDDLDTLGGDLAERVSILKGVDKKFGLKSSVFSKEDEGLFLKKLQNSNSHEFIKEMSRVWDGVNEADKDKIRYSYNKIDDPALSSLLVLTTNNDPTTKEVASSIAVGGKHRKDLVTKFKTEAKVDFKEFYAAKIRKRVNEIYSNGESNIDTTGKLLGEEKSAQVLELYILGEMHRSGDYSRKVDATIDKAMRAVLGGSPIPVNGCKLRPIRGMSVDEFQDTLHAYTSFILASKGWVGQAKLPETYGYANVGEGKFMLMFQRSPKLDDQGDTIILDMNDYPREVIDLMAKKRSEQRDRYLKLTESLLSNEAP